MDEDIILALEQYVNFTYSIGPLPDMFHIKDKTALFYQRSISKWAAEYILTEVQNYPYLIITTIENIRDTFEQMSYDRRYRYMNIAYDTAVDILDFVDSWRRSHGE